MSQYKRDTISPGLRADNMRREMINQNGFSYKYEIMYSNGVTYNALTNEKIIGNVSSSDLEYDRYYLELDSLIIPDIDGSIDTNNTFLKPIIVSIEDNKYKLSYNYLSDFACFANEEYLNKTFKSGDTITPDYFNYICTYYNLYQKGLITNTVYQDWNYCNWMRSMFDISYYLKWSGGNVGDSTHPVYFSTKTFRPTTLQNYRYVSITLTKNLSSNTADRCQINFILPYNETIWNWSQEQTEHGQSYIKEFFKDRNHNAYIDCKIGFRENSEYVYSSGLYNLYNGINFDVYISGNNTKNTCENPGNSKLNSQELSSWQVSIIRN